MPKMTWQAPGAPPSDPFAATEADVRAMTASPWWMGAFPPQRAEAITSRMLVGAGDWWLFGVWGRWYRCGLDGTWHLCPPPFDPAARQAVMPAPPGVGRPPVHPSILPAGPDLTPGTLAADGLFGAPPSGALLARLQQALGAASGVSAAQFPIQDPQFVPGTPSPVAVCLFAVLWCAGAPVADADHPILELFSRFLNGGTGGGPRWFLQPDLPLIVGAYAERLRAGDTMGAAHVVRTLWETAEALRVEPAFQPRADALAAMAGLTMQMVQNDQGGIRFGPAAVVQEWLRRCPPHLRISLLRETAPGDHLRLVYYDLASAAAALPASASGPVEARHVAFALLAADLESAPGAVGSVMRWLDPDGVRTLQMLMQQPGHPLRRLWPSGGVLPDEVAGADPQILRGLLAASYSAGLTWCRLAGMAPPRPGFTVPAALMNTIAAGPEPDQGGLTPWEIIEAARAHLAEQRKADAEPEPAPEAQPATTAWSEAEAHPAKPWSSQPGTPAPGLPQAWSSNPGTVPPDAAHPWSSQPGTAAWSGAEPPPGAAPTSQPGTTAWPGAGSPTSQPGTTAWPGARAPPGVAHTSQPGTTAWPGAEAPPGGAA